MFFIPYGHIQIRSKFRVDELENRLKDQLEPHSIVSGMLRGNHKYFQGSIENGEFKISRIIHYRNSFRPVIIGKLQPEIDHTVIELTIRLDFVVVAVLLLIVGSFILPMFSLLFQSLLFGQGVEFLQYLPEGYWLKFVFSSIGTFLFFYLFVMIPFNIEAGKATKYLDELFENQLNRQNNIN
jgi:hypothetical protein